MNSVTSEQEFIVANEWLDDAAQLKAMLRQNGYLFFRDIVPQEVVWQVRRDILELCAQAGWLDNNADLVEGIWSGIGPYTENEPEYMAVYRHVIRIPSFMELPKHPKLVALSESIIDGPVLVHRRNIGRITFPQNVGQTTGMHQDWHYIRGTPETYTLWTPLGDCPRELGGLAVLKGSHRSGFIEHTTDPAKKYAGAGLTEADLPQGEGVEWHTTDFRAGDAVLFHSHTIHKAMPNLTQNRLRLSTDNRYQRHGDEIAPGAMGTHYNL